MQRPFGTIGDQQVREFIVCQRAYVRHGIFQFATARVQFRIWDPGKEVVIVLLRYPASEAGERLPYMPSAKHLVIEGHPDEFEIIADLRYVACLKFVHKGDATSVERGLDRIDYGGIRIEDDGILRGFGWINKSCNILGYLAIVSYLIDPLDLITIFSERFDYGEICEIVRSHALIELIEDIGSEDCNLLHPLVEERISGVESQHDILQSGLRAE